MSQPKVIGIIPARYQSSRFPAKVLAPILGKTLVQRTYENMTRAQTLGELVIAVDDQRVFDHVTSIGAKAFMTPPELESGSARAAYVVKNHFPDADVVINIQADEPCLSPGIIDTLVLDLLTKKDSMMTTPVVKMTDIKQIFHPSVCKCVFDKNKKALYFSRAPIPYPQKNQQNATYYRHIGIYCFRKTALLRWLELDETHLRQTEDLEQLKFLEHGLPIHVSVVEYDGVDVNHPEDIQKVEQYLCKKENTSLSPVG